jgi:hypothetical protein
MKEYKIKASAYTRNKSRFILITGLIGLGAVLYPFITEFQKSGTTTSHSMVVAGLVGIVIVFVLIRTLPKVNEHLEKFSLTIGPEYLIIRGKDFPEHKLLKSEIIDIVVNHNGGLILKGINPKDVYLIPADVEDYEEVRASLNKIKIVGVNEHESFTSRNPIPTIVFLTVIIPLMYFLQNRIIAYSLFILYAGVASWIFFERKKNPYVEEASRAKEPIILIGSLAIIFYYIVLKK